MVTPQQPTHRQVFNVQELAERWKCSRGQLYAMVRQGKLKAFHVGALIRIPLAEVERVEATPVASSADEVKAKQTEADDLRTRIAVSRLREHFGVQFPEASKKRE